MGPPKERSDMNHAIENRLSSFRAAFIGVVALLLAGGGCSSYTVEPYSGPRPPLSADRVTIYQTQPKRFEFRGIVTLQIPADMHWDSNGDCNEGFDQLKALAG